jgi:hypothetical protein
MAKFGIRWPLSRSKRPRWRIALSMASVLLHRRIFFGLPFSSRSIEQARSQCSAVSRIRLGPAGRYTIPSPALGRKAAAGAIA